MIMRSKEFPAKPLVRIAKEATGKRISRLAARALKRIVLEKAEEKAREAVEICRHTGRKTVLESDVKFVLGEEED